MTAATSSGLTAEQRARAIRSAIGSYGLRDWLPGGDHQEARRHSVSTMAGWSMAEEHGQVTAKGIELWFSSHPPAPPQARITWREVLDTIALGLTTERLRSYDDACELWSAWCNSGGYGVGIHHGDHLAAATGDPEAQQRIAEQQSRVDQHQRAHRAAIDALHQAATAIIEAGCAQTPTQPALF